MSVSLAVALLALLVALFAVVALVAVYARVRVLESTRGGELSGYAALVGRAAPAVVCPRPGQQVSIVAVLDAGCALCRGVWDVLGAAAHDQADDLGAGGSRFVGLVARSSDLPVGPAGGGAELIIDLTARADLFEGYSPTLLAVDGAGTIVHRSFIYPDTDVRALVLDLSKGQR